MYCWSLANVDAERVDIASLINRVLQTRRVTTREMKECRILLSGAKNIDSTLYNLIEAGIDVVEKNADSDDSMSFLVEVLSGVKYASDDPSVGKLKHVSSSLHKEALLFLRAYCSNAMRMRQWEDKDMWFSTRVYMMDTYVLSIILREKKKTIIYYAGSAHTQNLVHYLLSRKLAHFDESACQNTIAAEVRHICDGHNFPHAGCLRLEHGPILSFIGECHNTTDVSFASEIVDFLKRHCNDEDVLFLIEKHISNQKDPLQTELMCNQPNLALHATRCHAFLENDHLRCRNLKVIPVDNRHADLGFLRMEIMELWWDARFAERGKQFNEKVLQCMTLFCDAHLGGSVG